MTTTITKEKITNMLRSKLGLSGVICEEIVNQIFSNIQEIIIDQKLILRNFGNFYIKTKKARPGINFHTKEKVTIPSKKTIHFIPAQKLKLVINQNAK